MKSSLGKLKKFALHNGGDAKEKTGHHHHHHHHHHPQSTAYSNELAQASLDMQEMRICYDSLLSAAAATANSAYEFSESLRDMGTCLQEKTVLNDDEESSDLLSMLGNVQFELQKLFDCYRSHVNLTITAPSESLVNELCTVEEMKRQCDEKRSLYEHMVAQQREKGRSKSGKMEVISAQQLQAACEEYNEEATLCVFRLKSLKQGQCRSLITQAARHHAAQLNFFRKGLKTLEAVEPQMKLVAEKQHIDYELTELEEGENDGGKRFDSNDDWELSFNYRANKQGHDAVLTSRNSMEVDPPDIPRFQGSTNAENMNRERRMSSYSAPLFAEKKSDPSEKNRDTQPSTSRKSYSYVLPTPDDARGVISGTKTTKSSQSKQMKYSGSFHIRTPFSQSEFQTHEKNPTDDNLPPPLNAKPYLKKDLSNNNLPAQSPPILHHPHFDANNTYDAKKIKRQAFSGPLTSKSSTNTPILSVNISPNTSPPILLSSPRISELHELPRPPIVASSIGHSAPLVFKNQEPSPKYKSLGGVFSTASPLPTPPLSVSRSFSIPSSSYQISKAANRSEEVESPPLTPISLSKTKILSNVSEIALDTGRTKGKR